MFDDYFARRRLRLLITNAVEALRSTRFDIDALVREMSQTREDIALIRSYISIKTAAQLSGPLKGSDVDAAFEELRATEKHLDQPGFEEILDIYRNWLSFFGARSVRKFSAESMKPGKTLRRKRRSQRSRNGWTCWLGDCEKGRRRRLMGSACSFFSAVELNREFHVRGQVVGLVDNSV